MGTGALPSQIHDAVLTRAAANCVKTGRMFSAGVWLLRRDFPLNARRMEMFNTFCFVGLDSISQE
jgi:hypothetical protein